MLRFIPWIIIGLILLGGLLPESICNQLDFNVERIKHGEVWRLLTGQLVHFGFNHSMMNALALAIVHFSLLEELRLRAWLMAQAAVLAVVACGLMLWSSDVSVYRGYSGAFHGILGFALLHFWRRSPRLALFMFSGLTIKIISEQMPGYDVDYLRAVIGVAVGVDAHLYGYIGGLIAQCAYLIGLHKTGKNKTQTLPVDKLNTPPSI